MTVILLRYISYKAISLIITGISAGSSGAVSTPVAAPDPPANGGDPTVQTAMALLGCFAETGLVGVDLVTLAVPRRGEVRHHDVRAAHEPQLPPLRRVERGKRGGARDDRLRAAATVVFVPSSNAS